MLALALIAAWSGGAPGTAVTISPAPAHPAAMAFKDEGRSDLLEWSLSYPAQVTEAPVLAQSLRAAFAHEKAENLTIAKADKSERAKQGFPFNAYQQSTGYEVAGDTPTLLSLTSEWMIFTGGAHPNHGTRAILWDKVARRQIGFASMLEGGLSTLAKIYEGEFCRALDAERAKRREGADLQSGPDDPFNQCPKLSELAIIPKGPAKGGPMTTLLFHADPYVAGPYVEGDYDIVLGVGDGLIGALEPRFRASFAVPSGK